MPALRTVIGDDTIPFCNRCRSPLTHGLDGTGRRYVLIDGVRFHRVCGEDEMRERADNAVTVRPTDRGSG